MDRIDFDDLLTSLPELKDTGNGFPQHDGPLPSHEQVLAKYRGRIARALLEWLYTAQPSGDRSRAMFGKYQRFFQSGLDPREVQSLIQSSAWNERFRSPAQLPREIAKAWGIYQLELAESQRATDRRTASHRFKIETYNEILAREVKDPGWMVKGLWPELAHGILAGEPKVRKSWLAIDIAVSVATGTSVFDHFEVPCAMPVLYIQEELSASELSKRMRWVAMSKELGGQVNVTPSGISVQFPRSVSMDVISRQQFDLTSEPDLEALHHEIVSREVKLVILDPLQMMLGSGDENSASSMRPILLGLQALKELTGCSIMLVHHYAKPSQVPKSGGQRMLGSQVFHAWIEAGLYLTKPEPYITHVEREFRNFEPLPNFEVEYVGGSERYAVAVTEEAMTQKAQRMSEFEFYCVKHPGLSLAELAETFKVTRPTIKTWAEQSEILKVVKGDTTGGRKPLIVVPST